MSTRLVTLFLAPLLALAVGVSPVQVLAQPFEGVITVRMGPGPRGEPGPEMEYMAKGGNVRMNSVSPLGKVGVVAVPAEGRIYVLLEAQRMYMEQPINGVRAGGRAAGTPGAAGAGAASPAGAKAPAAPVLKRTGRKETIAGHECEHVLVSSGQAENDMDVCIARGLGPFVSPASAMGGAAMPAWQRALMADGGFPLKVLRTDGKTLLEVTRIERRKLPAASFTVPDDFVKMDRPPGRGQ
ncbi:MAG: DUF4412 domain-containing protein [Gemmatimonadota bacterium]